MLFSVCFALLHCVSFSFSIPKVKPTNPLLFYIYEGSDWHSISTASTKLRSTREILHSSYLNGGCGDAVDETKGLYHTNQYQMFPLMYNRALSDRRRTLDPNLATTFFIPYDFVNDVIAYEKCPKNEVISYNWSSHRSPLLQLNNYERCYHWCCFGHICYNILCLRLCNVHIWALFDDLLFNQYSCGS